MQYSKDQVNICADIIQYSMTLTIVTNLSQYYC